MKKIILIGVLLINIGTTTSCASAQKSSLPWISVPLLGACFGLGYTFWYNWKEHSDSEKVRTIYDSKKKAVEADRKLDTTYNPIAIVKNSLRREVHSANANVAVVRLDLASDWEQEQLLNFDNKSKRREILANIWLRAKIKECTEINRDELIKNGATGAGIGLGLVAIASIFK